MENGVTNVANALHGEAWHVHACCLRATGAFAQRLPDPSLVRCLHKKPGLSLTCARQLARVLTELQPAVVHTHNLGPLIYTVAARRLSRCQPAIVHGEHAEFHAGELTAKRLALRRFLYRSCHTIHTVSDSLTQHLSEVGMPMARVITIRNGVDTQRFTPNGEAATLPFPSQRMVLGIVGRFGAFKGHDRLIDAFAILMSEHPALRLLVVGDQGPRKDAILSQMSQIAEPDRIHWAGFQEDPAPFYRAMNLLVIPSSNEGLPNAALEAMACGTPVLANASCGCGEALGSSPAGTLVAMDTPEEIARAIQTHCHRDDLQELPGQALAHVLEHFSISQMIEGYRALYTRAMM